MANITLTNSNQILVSVRMPSVYVISVSEVQKPASGNYVYSITSTVYFSVDLFCIVVCSLNVISLTVIEKPLKMVVDFLKKTFCN